MKRIALSKGQSTIIDDEDFLLINKYKWYCSFYGYAVRIEHNKGNRKAVLLHRLIMNAPSDMTVDHINGDKLDNRRKNLRLASQAENKRNVKIPITNKTGYKGVSFVKSRNKYRATINFEGKHIFLGHFDTAENASKVYNEAALKYFKEFARINK